MQKIGRQKMGGNRHEYIIQHGHTPARGRIEMSGEGVLLTGHFYFILLMVRENVR